MGVFDTFRRQEQPPEAIADAERVLGECRRLPGLVFHFCVLPSGHAGQCRFAVRDGAGFSVRLPDRETLLKRRQLVWRIADKLLAQESAHVAWGSLGLADRLRLGSRILELVFRVNGTDGGLPDRVRMP